MGLKTYKRHSAGVLHTARWKALRQLAKRRDGFKCVSCGSAGDLECDHVKPVRTHPELAYELSNLQCLCKPCHSAKTKMECGFGNELSPDRVAWRELLATMAKPNPRKEISHA